MVGWRVKNEGGDDEDDVEEQGLKGAGGVWQCRAPPPLQAR